MSSAVTHAIIGTAGHIDHGKTALIKALTGQDTDRLKEEKERGISIDLGFAYFTLPDGARAGIVDVPGHERFIRNMLAGAHGIDLVLFTIAADDGVMPQSEEHLDILHLLGIQRGIFVITKADLAAQERIAEVREEIELLADGTRLAAAPLIEVSSIAGDGIEQLRSEISHQLEGFEARRPTGIFRLPLDRAFTIKGHGTVVTGTSAGGEVKIGQKLRVLPAGAEVRVRSIQIHSETVEKAGLCQRVALNLSGAEKIEIKRGDLLADDSLDFTTSRFDASLEIRPAAKKPLKNNDRLRLFIGTAEVLGRAIVLDESGTIAPKSRGLVQIVLNEPVVALNGDRFVIRDEASQRTLGGGVVLNPTGRRNRKPLAVYRERLAILTEGAGAEVIEALLSLQDEFAMSAIRISQLLNRPSAEVGEALADQRFIKFSLGEEEGFTTRGKWDELKRSMSEAVSKYHKANPLVPGIEMESLRTLLPYEVSARAFRSLIDRVAREADLVREENLVRAKAHKVQVAGDDDRLTTSIEATLKKAGFQPPDLKQLAEELRLAGSDQTRLKNLLAAMERQGRVIKIASDLYFDRSAFDTARARLQQYLATNPEITAASFRDLLGASRKFAIALLDYFDHSGITIRVGDARRLRRSS